MKMYFLALIVLVVALPTYAQVVIGHEPKKLGKGSKYVLLELRVDPSKDTAQGLMLPLAKSSQRDSITKKKNAAKFPVGGLIFNIDSGTVDVWTKRACKPSTSSTGTDQKDPHHEWRSLSYGRGLTDSTLVLLALDTTAITASTTSGSSSATNADPMQCITLKVPEGYKPYTYKGSGSSGGTGSTDSVVVSLSYRGLALTPYEDFKAELGSSSGSGSTGTSGTNDVKVTFLTIVPEQKSGFEKILVQCLPNIKKPAASR